MFFVLCSLFFVLIGSYTWHSYQSGTAVPSNVQVLQASSSFTSTTDTHFIPTPQRADNEEIWKIARRVSKKVHKNKKVFIDLKHNIEVDTYETFFTQYKKAFGLRNSDEIKLVNSDDKTWKYQQYYKGIKVNGGEYSIAKIGDKQIFKAQGSILENLEIDTSKKITPSEAIQLAIDSLSTMGVKFIWEDTEKCKRLNLGKSCYPRPTLIITTKKRTHFEAKNSSLLYVFKIHLAGLANSYKVAINAQTKEVEYLYEDIQHNCISAKVATQHYGTKNFEIEQIGSEYALMAKCIDGSAWGGWVVPKTESNWTGSCSSYNSCLIKQNTPNGWITPTINQKAASALFAIEASYKYYKDNFGTWGYDNLKIVLESSTVGMAPENNSTGKLFLQADGNYTASNGVGYYIFNVTDLETIGHEIFHAIDQTHNSIFVAYDDMGTITEATADIFGAIITMKTLNVSKSSYDWIFGNSSTPTKKIMRSFKEPNQYGYHFEGGIVNGQPDFFQQNLYWLDLQVPPINLSHLDHYVNTGVINHWFYLLANGGSNNVNGVTKTVKNGINIDDIAKIMFHVFTDNDGLTTTDNIETFAQKVVDKANSLLIQGKLSTNDKSIICRIVEAFDAVNLEPDYPLCFLDVKINIQKVSAPDQCDCSASIEICGVDNYNIEWQDENKNVLDFGDPLNVSGLCDQKYTVKITVNGCEEEIEETIDCRFNGTGQIINPPLNEGDLEIGAQIVNDCGSGDVLLSVTGGNPPYSFAWSDGSTNQNLIGASAGIYYVTVSNLGQGIAPVIGGPYQVGYPDPMISAQITQPCHGSSAASIYSSAFGGTPPYSYQWSTGETTPGINPNLPTYGNDVYGFYSVTVTDFNGCSTQETYYVNDKPEIIVNESIVSACPTLSDGSIQLNLSGGTPPFQVQWNNNLGSNLSLSGLSEGDYTVTITDNVGCQKIKVINVPPAETEPKQDIANCTQWNECRGIPVTPATSVTYPQYN